jgi:hypothetical protein
MQGTRPERCMEYACEQIEWVVIPDARSTFHIAVQSVGDDFYLHASTAAYALNELSDTAVGECSPEDGCYETVGAVGQEGFMAWYRATNTLSIPPEGMASHQFGIRVSLAASTFDIFTTHCLNFFREFDVSSH